MATRAMEESRAHKRIRVERADIDLEDVFVSHLGLNFQRAHKEEEKDSEDHSGYNERIRKLEQNVALLSENLAAMKGQKDSENMMMEIGGHIFKGKQNVALWIEEKLPDTYPFGVFVDCYILLKMVLAGHSNVQATNMERNFKLKLKADKVLVLKTFENKLLMSFGKPAGDIGAIKIIMSTKISWIPGLPDYKHWETKNCLGGMKLMLQEQMGTVERQVREAIRINLPHCSKGQSVFLTCLETLIGFLHTASNFICDTNCDLEVAGFPLNITWQLVSKLVYQVSARDLDEVRSFMQISHGSCNHLTLASRSAWAVFKTIKAMKLFQLHGIQNHPSVVGTYMTFLVASSEMGQSDKLTAEVAALKVDVRALTAGVKAAKATSSSAMTKVEMIGQDEKK
eukprot:10957377-Ditylum_brightwellii.AAC.1